MFRLYKTALLPYRTCSFRAAQPPCMLCSNTTGGVGETLNGRDFGQGGAQRPPVLISLPHKTVPFTGLLCGRRGRGEYASANERNCLPFERPHGIRCGFGTVEVPPIFRRAYSVEYASCAVMSIWNLKMRERADIIGKTTSLKGMIPWNSSEPACTAFFRIWRNFSGISPSNPC